MRNNFRDDQSTGSIETSGFSDDDENEDQYDQEEESAPMAPIQGWDVFEVGYTQYGLTRNRCKFSVLNVL